MPLFLTGTRDQAFLGLVIQEAQRVTNQQGGSVGRTALQKIVYFLQALGLPSRYRFTVHHFGPFCDDIEREIEWLKVDEVVIDQSGDERISKYQPGPALDELLDMHRNIVDEFRPLVAEVVETLLPLETKDLELLSTMHYAYQYVKAAGGNGPWKGMAISQFCQFKGQKFSMSEMAGGYDRLQRARLVEP